MLDFRDKKRSPNNRTAPGKTREPGGYEVARKKGHEQCEDSGKKKRVPGEGGFNSSPGTLLLLDR